MRRLSRLLPLVVFAGACASAGAPAASPEWTANPRYGVDLRERTVEYEVTGRTLDEVTAALDEAAPRIDGRRFRGATRWNARWSFRSRPAGLACVVEDVAVTLAVTTTVPRWDPTGDPEPGLAERWAAYRAALDRHEAGHRDLAVEAANEVERTLRGVRAPCGALAEEADARARWIVERYRVRNRRYDRETGHGRTQGATWPPTEGEGGAVHAGSPER